MEGMLTSMFLILEVKEVDASRVVPNESLEAVRFSNSTIFHATRTALTADHQSREWTRFVNAFCSSGVHENSMLWFIIFRKWWPCPVKKVGDLYDMSCCNS